MGIGRKVSERGASNGIWGKLIKDSMSVVSQRFNDADLGASSTGDTDEQMPIFDLKLDDSEILELAKKYEQEAVQGSKDVLTRGLKNKEYWKGRRKDDEANSGASPTVSDNIIFSELEVLLPLASRQKAEPYVYSRGSTADENFAISKDEEQIELERKVATRVAAALYEVMRWIEE